MCFSSVMTRFGLPTDPRCYLSYFVICLCNCIFAPKNKAEYEYEYDVDIRKPGCKLSFE